MDSWRCKYFTKCYIAGLALRERVISDDHLYYCVAVSALEIKAWHSPPSMVCIRQELLRYLVTP
jgi:hypothetical protein